MISFARAYSPRETTSKEDGEIHAALYNHDDGCIKMRADLLQAASGYSRMYELANKSYEMYK